MAHRTLGGPTYLKKGLGYLLSRFLIAEQISKQFSKIISHKQILRTLFLPSSSSSSTDFIVKNSNLLFQYVESKRKIGDTRKQAVDNHVPTWEKSMNITCYMTEPPKEYEIYKSLMIGLNTYQLDHAFRENPIIHEDWIRDFWNNATVKKEDNVIRSKVQNKEILITEQVIREVLLFGDAADDPVEHAKEKVIEVLSKMIYEGLYPPTTKKLLHPY
ncbi:hypothetical protein Hdeb2414_s0011g00370121 [Helianthus debilis subsp. tardiflorus]